jgi:hypothetical protein
MYFLLTVILTSTAAYAYWLLSKKTLATLVVPTRSHFESVVPTATADEMEMSFEEQWEETNPGLVEDDETVLLMEAEKLISEIESIVATNHDVYAKLNRLLSGFNLFYNTDYHEAINRFIAVTVKRECNMSLSAEELASLWS